MLTANFWEAGSLPGRISIARYAPRNTPAGYKVFSKLAPGKWFNSVSKDRYIELFNAEVIGVLDAQETWDTLHQMVAPHEPVLMCWERRHDLMVGKTYCHRQFVADWFKLTLGHKVTELEPQAISRPSGRPVVLMREEHKAPKVKVNGGNATLTEKL